jgi:hypothetical protein
MARAAGGVGELAKALRVGNMTLWRWAHWKQTPHPLIRTVVNAWAQERGIDGPFPDEQTHPTRRTVTQSPQREMRTHEHQ